MFARTIQTLFKGSFFAMLLAFTLSPALAPAVAAQEAVIDSDGDGLGDDDEIALYGTDPAIADTDGDGLSDYDEALRFYTSPHTVDSDGDGLTDTEEIVASGTDPLNFDTDGDGYSDLEEISNGTNPFLPEQGGVDVTPVPDGSEAVEPECSNCRLAPDQDRSALRDRDRDTLSDLDESYYGTNPNNPDTDGDGYWDATELFGCGGTIGDPLNPNIRPSCLT